MAIHTLTENKTTFMSLLPLLMVVLLDVAGIILVLPVLTPLILQTDSAVVSPNTSLIMRDFLYGLALALFPIFMFFSTPILGDFSDKYGRKQILLLCLIISALSYLIAAFGIYQGSLFLLLASRAIGGLAAGTQPIATAAIIDLSTPETKIKNLSTIVFASSIGLILGPIVGGVTAENNLFSWFGFETPFVIAALVCMINAIYLVYSYQEREFLKPNAEIHFLKGFMMFIAAIANKKFRLLSLIYFCFVLAWSLYYQTINWFFMARFHYPVSKLGLFVGYIGIIFTITSLLARYILNFFSQSKIAYLVFILGMAIANLGAALISFESAQWGWVIFNAGGYVICFTLMLSFYSDIASPEQQGWIMGVTGSIGAITWALGALITGPLGYISLYVPFWTAGCLCLLSALLMNFFQQEKNKPATNDEQAHINITHVGL